MHKDLPESASVHTDTPSKKRTSTQTNEERSPKLPWDFSAFFQQFLFDESILPQIIGKQVEIIFMAYPGSLEPVAAGGERTENAWPGKREDATMPKI